MNISIQTIISLMIAALISGCASTYVASERTKNLVKNMSRSDALEIFHRAIDKDNTAANFCNLNITTDEPDSLKPTDYGFSVKAWKRGDKVGEEVLNGIKYDRFKKNFYINEFHLKSISIIRVTPAANRIQACNPELINDTEILIDYGGTVFTNWISFGVTREFEEEFVAAITILAPNVEIAVGAGF